MLDTLSSPEAMATNDFSSTKKACRIQTTWARR